MTWHWIPVALLAFLALGASLEGDHLASVILLAAVGPWIVLGTSKKQGKHARRRGDPRDAEVSVDIRRHLPPGVPIRDFHLPPFEPEQHPERVQQRPRPVAGAAGERRSGRAAQGGEVDG